MFKLKFKLPRKYIWKVSPLIYILINKSDQQLMEENLYKFVLDK